MEDNIFKQENNENINEFTNPNLTGDYQNVETVKVDPVKLEQELAKDIVSNAKDVKKPEKELANMDLLLKSDSTPTVNEPVQEEHKNLNINNKFINYEKEDIVVKKQENVFNNFDNLYTDFVPADNKITNEYKVPDIELGEEDNIEKINL